MRSPVDIDFADLAILRLGRFEIGDGSPGGPLLRGVPLHPTSGSTGLPKIALRPGFAAMEEARHYTATMAIDGDDTIMAIPPMSHAYGYGMCVMVPLLTGANIVSTRQFSVKLIHRALAEYPITILPTVPAMLDVLSLGRRRLAPRAVGAHRRSAIAGAARRAIPRKNRRDRLPAVWHDGDRRHLGGHGRRWPRRRRPRRPADGRRSVEMRPSPMARTLPQASARFASAHRR